MDRMNRYGGWMFAGLLCIGIAGLLRPADAQSPSEPPRRGQAEVRSEPHGRCVGIAATVARDGGNLLFRAFEDGTVEERRVVTIGEGRIVYAWKPALQPADDLFKRP